jgi:integrase
MIDSLELLPPHSQHTLVERALSAAVRARHRGWLRHIKESLLPAEREWRLVDVLLAIVTRFNTSQRWQPQTLSREMALITGAFSNLPIYTTSALKIDLVSFPEWKAALKTADADAQKAQPTDQVAAEHAQVAQAVEANLRSDPLTAMALILLWLLCARPGCIIALRRRNLTLEPGGRLRCTFTKGKGVEFRGPYTVATTCPPDWLPHLEAFLRTRQPHEPLFPLAPGERPGTRHRLMLAALRTADPNLNLRATRRGSLQALAQAGVPLDTVMTFSGHKEQKTLLRYLNWGKEANAVHEQAFDAARHLAPQL